MTTTIRLAQEPEADALLARSPLAALVGMLLDQQIPMEWAFAGPYTLARRMNADDLDAHDIAAYEPEAFAALMSEKPAVHRYPGSMAKRVQQLCQYLVDHYDGDAAAVWKDVKSGAELFTRLSELPGYGKQKAQIFTALLGKQYGVAPKGWREAAGAYGEQGSFRSVADITGPESLEKVRATKQEAKKAAKEAAGAKGAAAPKKTGTKTAATKKTATEKASAKKTATAKTAAKTATKTAAKKK
ncbi:HhH-GPD-type base excision DNA repair protein [Streptodolium elevatio]|uniref:HhH-GPD-type base excision DNA repair protein n=1 Tax=Streptodolium elevatio TaxID=3157996 RepID=UPI003F4D07EA